MHKGKPRLLKNHVTHRDERVEHILSESKLSAYLHYCINYESMRLLLTHAEEYRRTTQYTVWKGKNLQEKMQYIKFKILFDFQ